MAENTEYITSGNNADLVKLIKDYALFLFRKNEQFTPPTSTDWAPPKGKKPVGYNSEDGATLHPEPGDTTEIKAHNGDIAVSETSPGNWTLQIPSIESSKDIVEAYFGTIADAETGALHVKDASTGEEYSFVLAALDQHGNPIIMYAQRAKVTDRDDITMNSTDVMTYNITLSMFKGTDGYQFHAYGLLPDASTQETQDSDGGAESPGTQELAETGTEPTKRTRASRKTSAPKPQAGK